MNWSILETIYMNAWKSSFSKHRLLIAFSALSLCGILFVFCRAFAFEAGAWMHLSLLFLPFFLSSSLLFALGVLLVRMYMQEKKGIVLNTVRFFAGSIPTAIGTSYLSLPPIFGYLCLWIALGLFFLLKEIPYFGPFFNVVLAFGPFLLIFAALVLCLLNIGLLFFIAPVAAHQPIKNIDALIRIWRSIRAKPFLSCSLFLIGLAPVLLMGGMLMLTGTLTNVSFSPAMPAILLAFEWFFVMLPFSALLSPAILFFFHFAAESHQLLQNHSK